MIEDKIPTYMETFEKRIVDDYIEMHKKVARLGIDTFKIQTNRFMEDGNIFEHKNIIHMSKNNIYRFIFADNVTDKTLDMAVSHALNEIKI